MSLREGGSSMYAIAFDLDTQALSENYHNQSHNNAYNEIRIYLESKGFGHQQGSVYFGDNTVDAVKTVLAVQGLARKFPWFSPSVRDIQMLRIEEHSNLLPAIREAND
ncbi:MAG: virulence factor [Desulfitobacterium hafniense]|nr:virulence factor [Desulfitobacterium hafniense]